MADFNLNLAEGKWNHFMDQTHLGYTSWNDPPRNSLRAVSPDTSRRAFRRVHGSGRSRFSKLVASGRRTNRCSRLSMASIASDTTWKSLTGDKRRLTSRPFLTSRGSV